MEPAIDKVALRKELIRQRLALNPETVQDYSQQICDRLQTSPQFQTARTILAYLSIRKEPDLNPLWSTSSRSTRWGLPRCVGKDLVFHDCDPTNSSHFHAGAYGIQEPLSALPVIQPETVDWILVPAVACDRQGYRLGYGAGYYDRLFAQPQWAKIPAIGIVFHFALLTELPRDPWDFPLQGVCTEQELTSLMP
jgi:5-formyltetrahydrofolate cyclo-ligase